MHVNEQIGRGRKNVGEGHWGKLPVLMKGGILGQRVGNGTGNRKSWLPLLAVLLTM